jgi:hypothetical protein
LILAQLETLLKCVVPTALHMGQFKMQKAVFGLYMPNNKKE